MRSHPLLEGVLCALGAGLVWGLVFVAPTILKDYPPPILAFGRYLAFGLIALPLAVADLRRLAQLERRDWLAAVELALTGNILYYICLAASIQLAGGPLPTMIIGTLPVVIAITSNLHEGTLPWPRLLPSLLVIATGIALVNHHEQITAPSGASYTKGIAFAFAAVACWTWYPVRNSRWLKRRPGLSSGTWATAQGLATLPLAAAGMFGCGLWYSNEGSFSFPLGPQPMVFVALMLTLGLLASWLGTLLWNRASKLLPTALAGQMIVFETLAALCYTFVWRGTWPAAGIVTGALLLVLGVSIGVRAFQRT